MPTLKKARAAPDVPDRKGEHLRIAAGDGVAHERGTGLAAVRLRHRALPGRDLRAVELGTTLLGAGLNAPFVVSAMTNWALVEGRRDPEAGAVAAAFADWGVGTREAIAGAVRAGGGRPVIASGGVRDGVEAAKCLALGASAVGFARSLLQAAQADRAGEALDVLLAQLQIATWAAGAPDVTSLGLGHLAAGGGAP